MRYHTLCLLVVLLSQTLRCHAALVTDISQFPSGASLIEFSQFTTTNFFGPGPVEVGQLIGESVLWSSAYSNSLIVSSSNPNYGLGANGVWSSPMTFAGVNGQPDGQINSMRFDFVGGPVRSVGGLINYVPNNNAAFAFARISALDINGSAIETYNLMSAAPISTPGATNQGAFRGIVHAADDIYAFELSNAVIAIDDLRFARVVPEPTSAALLSCGVLLLAHRCAFRRRTATANQALQRARSAVGMRPHRGPGGLACDLPPGPAAKRPPCGQVSLGHATPRRVELRPSPPVSTCNLGASASRSLAQ